MPIRTAVIGYGVGGSLFHAPFLAADNRYSLDVIVTGDAARAAEARSRYPGVNVVATVDEVWRHAGDLDLVVVASPPASHVELATLALAHGLHTVVDKPFAPTSAEARRLIESAAQADRLITVFQNRRWDGDFLTLRRLIAEGELGEVTTFESRFEWWKPDGAGTWKATTNIADGGGILFDLGTHLMDQAMVLFGDVVDWWADPVRRATDGASDADDDTFVALTHASGTRSRLTMSSRSALPAPRFHVLGTRAAHTKWGPDPQEAALKAGAVPTDEGFGVETGRSVVGVGDLARDADPERGDYGAFYRQLADAVTGTAPVPVDPADAVVVLELIECIHGARR